MFGRVSVAALAFTVERIVNTATAAPMRVRITLLLSRQGAHFEGNG